MKKHLIWLLLLSSLSFGQTLSVVTATITDPSGQAFINGTMTAQYLSPPNAQGIPMSAGVPIATQGAATLDGTGTFTVSLADLSTISPTGGTWQFTLCSQATAGCQQVNSKLVIGASPNLSTSLSSQITTLVVGPNVTLSRAYKDAELSTAPGMLWLDTIIDQLKFVDATGTVRIVGTGSGVISISGGTGIVVSPNPITGTGTVSLSSSVLINPMTTLGDMIYENITPAATRLAGPTTPNGISQALTSTSSGSVAQTPVWQLPGIAGRAVTGTTSTDTILTTDCAPNRVEYVGSVAVATTLPTAATLAVPACVFKLVNETSGSSTAVTITPTTWTINGGATLVLAQGQSAFIYIDPNSTTNWQADVYDPPLVAGTNITLSRAAQSLTIAASSGSTLTGTGTTNFTTKWTGTTSIGNGSGFDDGTHFVAFNNGIGFGSTGGAAIDRCNDATTGTVLNKFVIKSGTAGCVVLAPTTARTGVLGVAVAGVTSTGVATTPGTTGNTSICNNENCAVIMDNTSVVGHYGITSTTIAGAMHDSGSTTPLSGIDNFYILSVATAGNAAQVEIGTPDWYASQTAAKVYALQVNGGTVFTAGDTVNLNATTPADAGAYGNCAFATSKSGTIDSISLNCDTPIGNAVAGINPAVAVQAATAAILPNSPTFTHVDAGVGSLITTTTLNTPLVVDGYTPVLLDRILVKNEASGGGLGASRNGVYLVTQVSGVGLAWILTRALDFDQSLDINNTGAIPVINGTVNTATQWVVSSKVTTVDTDAITFTQFSVNPSNIVLAVSPGVGIAHFAGSTQTVTSSAVVGSDMANNTVTATQLASQYSKLRCETGLGDGLNAITAGTYLQSMCYNDSGVTWTITGIKCYTDNGGTSTLNAAGNTLGALLTGAITCSSSWTVGTQSSNVLLTNGDYIKFTFVADGTSKQTTWLVSMTQ
jgi:hypothetical protein